MNQEELIRDTIDQDSMMKNLKKDRDIKVKWRQSPFNSSSNNSCLIINGSQVAIQLIHTLGLYPLLWLMQILIQFNIRVSLKI